MEQAEKKRKLWLGGALIATLVAVVMVEEEEPVIESVKPVERTRLTTEQIRKNEGKTDYLDVDQLGQRKFSAEAGDLFQSTAWVPDTPQVNQQKQANLTLFNQQAARAPAPPPDPTPPPLQFKYIGKVVEEHEMRIFLSESDQYHVVKLGERIDDQYRLDAVNEETISFTYLPLNAKQTLTINN